MSLTKYFNVVDEIKKWININKHIFALIDTFYDDEDEIIKSYEKKGYSRNKMLIAYKTSFWRDYDLVRNGLGYYGSNGVVYPYKFSA
jgi:hypothetical protein